MKSEKPKPIDYSTGITEKIWPDNLKYEKPQNTFDKEEIKVESTLTS